MFKKKNFKEIFIYLIIISIIISIIYKLYFNITPEQDQISYIYWLHNIASAKDFFPINYNNFNLIETLKHDQSSLLNALLSPLYTSPTSIFTLISLIFFYLFSLIFGFSVSDQILISIIANFFSLIIFVFGSIIFIKVMPKKKLFILIFLFFLLTSSFLNGFSTYGTHNVGIFFLVISMFFLIKYIELNINSKKINKFRILSVTFQAFAIYSMYTNIFILIPTVVIALLLNKAQNFYFRIKEIFLYLLLTSLTLFPALILHALTSKYPLNSNETNFLFWFKYAFNLDQTNFFNYLLNNFISWFKYIISVYGFYYLLFSFVGLIILYKNYKQRIWLIAVLSHLTISTFMIGFVHAFSRTAAYILPVLIYGLSIYCHFLYSNFFNSLDKIKKKYFIVIILSTFGIFFDLINNINQLINPDKINASWSKQYKNLGNNFKKLVINDIIDYLPAESVVIPFNDRWLAIYSYKNEKNILFYKSLNNIILNDSNKNKFNNKFNNFPKNKIFFLKEDKLELNLDVNIIKQIVCNDPESCTNINIFLDQTFYKDKNYYLYALKYE
jgi:hypothetical protein